jgi:multidrug efflux pump subunit AcrA (membrane-fusion protein)
MPARAARVVCGNQLVAATISSISAPSLRSSIAINSGVVGELRVRDGDHVRAGDILVRLDDTVTRANLTIVAKGLDELNAHLARLEAEKEGADLVSFPYDMTVRSESSRSCPTFDR